MRSNRLILKMTYVVTDAIIKYYPLTLIVEIIFACMLRLLLGIIRVRKTT